MRHQIVYIESTPNLKDPDQPEFAFGNIPTPTYVETHVVIRTEDSKDLGAITTYLQRAIEGSVQ